MSWQRRAIGLVAALGALAALVLAFRPRPLRVETGAVRRGRFEQTVDEEGKTRVKERYVVSAPLAGTLARIELEAGDPVDEGTVLATLVPLEPALLDVRSEQELQARLEAAEAAKLRARAALERAGAAHDFARRELERWQRLAESNVAARRDLERAESEVHVSEHEIEVARFGERVAEHEVETARAALVRARPDPSGARADGAPWLLHSPIRGRVLRVLHESEGAVALGTELLEIADPAALEVVVDALTTDAVQIPPGAPVRIERWGGEPVLAGRVRLVEPSAFTKISALGIEEQRVNVVIDLVSPRAQWESFGDGFRVETRILIHAADDAVTAPASALFRDRDGWAVFVVEGGRARRRAVQAGRRNALEVVILDGLAPGERVILHPTDAIRDQARVRADR